MNTPRAVLRYAALLLALAGCRGDAERVEPAPADSDDGDEVHADAVCNGSTGTAWRVLELVVPAGFRAFGWGAADTIWGIARGRVAAATLQGDTLRLGHNAWSLQTDPVTGLVTWTNGAGLWRRGAGGSPVNARAARPPGPEYTGPEVLWAPGGQRALLTWTAEAGPRHSVLEGDRHRVLNARLPGYMAGAPTLWLNDRVAVLSVTAHRGRLGESQHRERGYRADLALLDVTADSIWRITDVADGEFLTAEGLLASDSVLIGLVTDAGWPVRHDALTARGGSAVRRLEQPGRAAARAGCIALLRPLAAPTHEAEWELVGIGRPFADSALARFRGFDVRLLWHPTGRRLAVAQESEQSGGYRTIVVSIE